MEVGISREPRRSNEALEQGRSCSRSHDGLVESRVKLSAVQGSVMRKLATLQMRPDELVRVQVGTIGGEEMEADAAASREEGLHES